MNAETALCNHLGDYVEGRTCPNDTVSFPIKARDDSTENFTRSKIYFAADRELLFALR